MDTSSRSWFMSMVTLSQIFGLGSVVMMAVWMSKYQGGYGWGYKNAHKFNYHPLFMTIGMIFLYGDAILAYRVFKNEKKIIIKILHAVMQLAAIGFAITALVAVFSSHNDGGFPNMYSIHSWIGLTTVIMFCLQFVFGLLFYLTSAMPESLKAAYMSSHRYWGVAIFCMAIATALMGIVENVGFKLQGYSARTPEAYVVNFLGVFLVLFGWMVTFIVQKPEWKREPASSDYQIQQEHD